MGYVSNIISIKPFQNSLSFNSGAHIFLRNNKQATEKHAAKDECTIKNQIKVKPEGRRSILLVLRRGLLPQIQVSKV